MDAFHYYHYCAKGADAQNFILCEADFKAVFNIIAVCAAVSGAIVVSFSIEDTHPHILLYGTLEQCARFKVLFEKLSAAITQWRREKEVQIMCFVANSILLEMMTAIFGM
ncbi:MAG: hypothetical protein IJS91_05160 [Bacteroidales bacterium]|nr:hypothetical protein [Bacteroidales bacterium]